MRNTTILMFLVLTTTCMGFDAKKFADDYDFHDYAEDIKSEKRSLLWEDMTEVARNIHTTNLQNYYAVTSLSKVRYSIKVKDATIINDRKLFSDTKCNVIEGIIRHNVIFTLKKYDVTEVKSTTPDIPLINVEIRIDNDSRVSNATCIEIQVMVIRTLLDPISKRPITATVWGDPLTHVYSKQHPDLEKEIIDAVDRHVYTLAWSQYESITTMKAAIELDKEGKLPESFSEYMIK